MAKPVQYPNEKLISFDNELLEAVEDYRYSMRFPSLNAAVRELVRLGLAYSQDIKVAENPSRSSNANKHGRPSPQLTAKALNSKARKSAKAVVGEIPDLVYVSEEEAERTQRAEAEKLVGRIGARR